MNPDTDTSRPLAILGGPPAFAEPLHVGRPNIADRERFSARVNEILDRNWLTNNGPFVREFERRIADYVGVKHCIAVCNATIGLELAIRASGLRGEVIVPSYTFIATAHALQWQEITPVFADIDPTTHTLDPALIERHITPRTTGIIATHLWGRPCEVAALTEIARRRSLVLLFDAAHAFGCSYRGQMLGGSGHAEIFSFHATKFLNAFEGGAITTNDDELAAKVRLMKNFGFKGYDNVVYIGTNGKMTEISAAMGLTNFECLDRLVATNRSHYETYQKELAPLPGVRLLPYSARDKGNYQYVVLEIENAAQLDISRDELVEVLHAENVLARRYFWPGCHRMEPYVSYYPHAHLLLPETERVAARVVVLPTGSALSNTDVLRVCQIIQVAITNAPAVRTRLAENRSQAVRPFSV